MTKYIGYVDVPHSTYDEWKNATLDNGYDIDSSYGCQCWDFASLFWRNVGFGIGYPIINSSSAYTMWENRNANISFNGVTYFDLIYNLADVEKGDIMVFNYNTSNPYGHVGFANQTYSTWTPDPSQPYEFPILSENNGGTPDPAGGAYVNIHGYDTRLFLGAFRYKNWHIVPPVPVLSQSDFKWVLYARRLREKRGM